MREVRELLRLVRFTGRYFTLCLGFGVVIYLVVPLLLGLVTQAFFDGLARHAHLSELTSLLFLVGLQLLGVAASPLFGSPWSPMQQKAHVLLRRNLVSGILRGYGTHGLTQPLGEIVTRFRDDPVLIADVLDSLCDLIGRTLFAAAAGVVMWRINPLLTVALFIPLVLSSITTQLFGNRIRGCRDAAREASGKLTAFLADLLAGQMAIRVAGAGPNVIRRLEALGTERRKAEVRDSVVVAVLDAFNLNFGNLGTGIVLLLGVTAMRSHAFTVGDLALFVVYLDALNWYPDEVGRMLGGLKQIGVSLRRMHVLVPAEPADALVRPAAIELKDPAPPLRTSIRRERLDRIQVVGLTYQHPSSGQGIVDVSFTLERGSLTVITGPVGGGKSTLLQVVLGLQPRDRGVIAWNGRRIDDPATFFIPPRSAYTPQLPRLFGETVRENVLLGWPSSERALADAVHTAVLEPDLETFENGLDTLVGPRGVRLSGGQVQRIAAARMLVREAELLVFDDLSSALDAHTESELWERLWARNMEQTYLVVSHRPSVLRRADQVLVMEAGRLRPNVS